MPIHGLEIFADLPIGADPRTFARVSEDAGFDGVACSDHYWLSGPYPHLWASLAAMAAVTERVTVVPSFANNLLRSPFEFAQASTTLWRLADGRYEAGLGAGWTAGELTATGQGYPPGPVRARMCTASPADRPRTARHGRLSFPGRALHVRYAVGIDTKDFVLYRSIFAPEIYIDFASYSGGEPATMTSDAWVQRLVVVFGGLAATQQSMSNPITAVDGDEATCRMYIRAHHVLDDAADSDWFTIGGFYDDTLVRSPDAPAGWLLTGVCLTVLWRHGNRDIMATALQRGLAAHASVSPDTHTD